MSNFSQHIADSELSLLAESSDSIKTHNLVLIDSKVKDLDQLIAGVQPNTAVYVLHPQENGIEQITAILQQHPQVKTVHLVAHGEPGCLYLGNNIVTEESLSSVGESLKSWKIEQLLIYACNVAAGSQGEAFLQRLHHFTKAKIAAASHAIGQTEFGQNWQLNKTTHPIEIKSVFNAEVMATYSGVLGVGDLLDTSFGSDGIVTGDWGGLFDQASDIKIQSNGKIVVAGTANSGYGRKGGIVRYNSNGSLDKTFSGDGKVISEFLKGATSIAVQPDGKIVATGDDSLSQGLGVVRYNQNGTLDTTFDGDGHLSMWPGNATLGIIAVQPDSKIVVAADAQTDLTIVRFNSNGSLDTTFDDNGSVVTHFSSGLDLTSMAVQPDGKIVVAGYVPQVPADNSLDVEVVVVRYNSNGSLDTTFGGDGIVTTNLGGAAISSMALQPDGKIIVSGSYSRHDSSSFNGENSDVAVVRYKSNGSLDTTFSGDGIVTTNLGGITDDGNSIAVQSDGKIVVAASGSYPLTLLRYNSNGSLDTTFSSNGQVITPGSWSNFDNKMQIDDKGKIIGVGNFSATDGSSDFAILRYLNNSALPIINGTDNNNNLTGTANPEILNGLGGNDKLVGNGGNDILNAGDGKDTLTGGSGADKFLYNTNAAFDNPWGNGTDIGIDFNADTITDFTIAQKDKIVLDKTTFTKISSVPGTGFSINSEFATVNKDGLAATRAADIVYNTLTGGLFYNQNGTAAGFGTGGQFLTLTNKPVLTENQFLIQA